MPKPSAHGLAAMFCAALALGACAAQRPRVVLGPPPTLPEARRAARPAALPEWYWEPVDADVRAEPKAIELPLPEKSVTRVEGATRAWDELNHEGRERLCKDGIVVASSLGAGLPRFRVGAFYAALREQRIPYVLTLDALFFAAHLAFERALAEVDEVELGPALGALLTKLEARLGAEQKGAGVEVAEGLRLARGVVAVAQVLAAEGKAAPPAELGPELVQDVVQEVSRVEGHAGRSTSALLGVPLDYSRFAAPSGVAKPGAFRALAWLGGAPFALVGKSEAPGAIAGIGAARAQTRAAMLLARLVERDVDPQIHEDYKRVSRLLSFLWGPPDDVSPAELADVAAAANTPLADPKNIASVVKVDALRKRIRTRAPRLSDGSGPFGVPSLSVRMFGGHASADSIAMASLTGQTLGTPIQNAIQNPTQRAAGESRTLPSLLDVVAWLGVDEARSILRESGASAFTGYDDALTRAVAARPKDDSAARHASVYGSLLDALIVWGGSATGSRVVASSANERRRIESMLAAWTLVRRGSQPLARGATRAASSAAPANAEATEISVTGAPLPAFVEPEPDVIARLVAATAQMKRGLAAIGGLKPSSPSLVALAELEDILRLALRVASSEVNDEGISADDATALAAVPARLVRLEAKSEIGSEAHSETKSETKNETGNAGANASPLTPVVAHVFSDLGGDRALSTATGAIEPAMMLVREPGSGRVMLGVGSHLAHHEIVEPLGRRTTDASFRARIADDSKALPRAAYTETFRLVRESR